MNDFGHFVAASHCKCEHSMNLYLRAGGPEGAPSHLSWLHYEKSKRSWERNHFIKQNQNSRFIISLNIFHIKMNWSKLWQHKIKSYIFNFCSEKHLAGIIRQSACLSPVSGDRTFTYLGVDCDDKLLLEVQYGDHVQEKDKQTNLWGRSHQLHELLIKQRNIFRNSISSSRRSFFLTVFTQ